MKQILKYLIFIMIGIIIYSYINSYNTFSIGIPSEYYNYVLDLLRNRKRQLIYEQTEYTRDHPNQDINNDDFLRNLYNSINILDLQIQELVRDRDIITEDRLTQIDNREFFNLFFRPCAAAHLRV